MTHDEPIEPDAELDLETAYRRALAAVDATDLPSRFDWQADRTSDDDETPDVLPFPSLDRSAADGSESDGATPSRPDTPQVDTAPRVTPRQIIEAAVFVGGIELTAERLAGLLKGDFSPQFVERTINEINQHYADQGRPYEIRCEENLYRLTLREQHEPLRRRVYGLGPKEVKLSQDALEVLSLVAYRQPISRTEIESLREGNAGNVLRQLVRRQLVAIQRDGNEPDAACYVTTNRFLEVFGLANLDELPTAQDLSFK